MTPTEVRALSASEYVAFLKIMAEEQRAREKAARAAQRRGK